MNRTIFSAGVLACAGFAAQGASAQDKLNDAALLEASLRQQWLGIDEQVRLRRIDQEALSTAKTFHEGASAPSPELGDGGRVVFEFGRSVPRILCTPFRVCDIELQAGETVQGAPLVGDGDGWIIEPAFSGNTPHVVVKPKIEGISTNLAVYTNKRVYHLELQATRSDLMPQVSFSYPEDRQAKWLALAQNRGVLSAAGAGERASGGAQAPGSDYEITVTPGALNFNYEVKKEGRWLMRRRIDWLPLRAFDDGEKTFVEMPRKILARELPVLFVRDGDGKDKIVNYRVKGKYFVVDRLFEHGVLVKGIGWRQERVGVHREGD
jgi:type IV secretion system protein TrbG